MSAFTGKVVIVTGASEGIGRALCLELAKAGAKVAAAARNVERLEELTAEIEALGGEALAVPTDVADEAACQALIDRTVQTWGRIDALVCNAGMTMWTRLDEITDTGIYERLMRVNYLGSVYPTIYALPHLKESRGLIVGVSSLAGFLAVPERTAYAATKHAQFGFFDALRVELLGSGVDVTMIAPDFVLSEIHRRALDGKGGALGVSPLEAGGHAKGIMTSETAAQLTLKAMQRRQRLAILSARGRLGRWGKLIAPGVADRIALAEMKKKRGRR